jgi:hypothetical protein
VQSEDLRILIAKMPSKGHAIVSAQKDQALSIESEVNVGTPVIDECQPEKICPTQPNL